MRETPPDGRRWAAAALAAALTVATAGAASPAAVFRADDRPNVVLVVLDTVRQDHLSCYGYERNTSPNLVRLLEDSTVYDRAYSVSSWTAPGHASLFTGLYPGTHGSTQEDWTLDGDLLTLAEVLSREGYRTTAIVENPVVSRSNRFHQGFDEYHETWQMKVLPAQHDGYLALIRLREVMEGLRRDRPFFLFFNIIEPHNPYDSGARFANAFVRDPTVPITSQSLVGFYLGAVRYTERELDHLRDLYDGEIRFVDYMIGRIVEELERHGSWEDTVFIVTSDHGENIGDHGHVDHVFSLYESTIKVPLMIRYPPRFAPGVRDGRPVQLTDVFPTITELLGLDDPSQGSSLLDDSPARDRPVFCEYYRPRQALRLFGGYRDHPRLKPLDRHLKSVIRDGMKLIWASDGRHELYDLSTDPRERVNLYVSPEHAAARRELHGLLEEVDERYRREGKAKSGEDLELDEATRDALRSLGYIR